MPPPRARARDLRNAVAFDREHFACRRLMPRAPFRCRGRAAGRPCATWRIFRWIERFDFHTASASPGATGQLVAEQKHFGL